MSPSSSHSRNGDTEKARRLRALLEENPQISSKEVMQGLRLIQELRKQGIQSHRYDLVTPFTRRVTAEAETESSAPSQVGATAFIHRQS